MEINDEHLDIRLSDIPHEFITCQFEQAFETFRAQMNLLVQILTILVLANVTVIGFAISSQIAGIVFIGTLFPILIYYVMNRVNSSAIPVIYTAICIENKYGGGQVDWLASTYMANTNSFAFLIKIRNVSNISDPVERANQLRLLKFHIWGKGKGLTRGSLVIIFVGQLLAPFLLTYFFNWRFF